MIKAKGFTKEELFVIEVRDALYDLKDDFYFRLMVENLLEKYNIESIK